MGPAYEPLREEIVTLTLSEDADVFAARQLGRDLATVIRLDRLDATRLATAISELAREAVAAGGGRLSLGIGPRGDLVATLSSAALTADSPSVRSAERLVDAVTVETVDGQPVVVLVKEVTSVVDDEDRERMRRLAAAHAPTTPLEELRQQNDELVAVLDTVRAANAELETLNLELEETNRGVMALYTELSGELERTNQGVVALYAEIDDKNEQLTAASEAKSRFLRSISHELRTPVNSVLGLTRLLMDPGAGPLTAEQAEQVEFIRASATDLLTLVNELLDLARAESGRLEPVERDVDLAALCTELAGLTVPLLRDGVELQLDPGPEGLRLHTDPDLLRHVLRNLLSNAAKFTATGTVRFVVEATEESVAVAVADTGLGMTEEERARVFEEFFQARTPLHATTKGTGLGLPFALSVAQALGGDIRVQSEPGVGSTFTLQLPLRTESAGSPA